MKISLVEATNRIQLKNIKKLYKEAFPKCERKPFSLMLKKQKQGYFDILSIEDEKGLFLGLAIIIKYQDIALIDYFAISKDLRGMGVGTKAITAITEKYKDKKTVLEIEPPSPDQSEHETKLKRKQFYQNNGFSEAGFTVSLFGVPLEVMVKGEIDFLEYHEIFKKVFSEKIAKRVKLIDTKDKL